MEEGQPQRLLQPGVTLDDHVGGLPAPCPRFTVLGQQTLEAGVLGFVETCASLSMICTVGDDAIDALVSPRVALGRPEPSLLGARSALGEERVRPPRPQQGGAGPAERRKL